MRGPYRPHGHLPDAPGAGVKPRVVRYEGGDLVLNEEKGIVMRAAEFESLAKYKVRS